MNYHIYYKGQSVSVTGDRNANIKQIYDLSVPKFKQHFIQELLLFGNNVKLRLKRNNGLLEWKETANVVMLDNDTIIIEPKDNILTSSNQNCHTPKRYDISNIDNKYSGITLKSPNVINSQSNQTVKLNNSNDMDTAYFPKSHRAQKFDQIRNQSKENHNNFDRNGLRRSLGAAIAPQYEMPSLDLYYNNNNFYGSNTNNSYQKEDHSSDSSISDLYTKDPNPSKKKPKKVPVFSNRMYGVEDKKQFSKSAPASPTKPIPPLRSPHTHLSMMNAHNVRTIGKKINISILKKPNIGLGFTIVTRDNQVIYGSGADISNSVIILVNKILQNGGASDDGRLLPGDRILEVNHDPVTSLKDATDKLRAIPENTMVEILISRIEKSEPENDFPAIKTPKNPPQLTFEISLLSRHKENLQLGLNIHYRNENDNPPLGPGIYIHSILNHSLAAQQGGLQVNDKLVGVNGHSLGDSVETIISLLKNEMQNNSVLAITVLRDSLNEPSSQMDNNAPKLLPKMNNEMKVKPDNNYFILPDKMTMNNKPRVSLHQHENKNSNNNINYNSRNSSSDSYSQNDIDVNNSYNSNAFEREGKGRRSMSEKGKIHEDATKYKIYKNSRDASSRGAADQSYTTDRAYSTLPTTSHKKKLQEDQSPPPLPNKMPIKPSQIKIKNAQESGPRSSNGTPNRSSSLRDSPRRIPVPNKSHSPNRYSQTPTRELLIFNRAMNNSFKKAVQSSNEHKKGTQLTNNSLSQNTGKSFTTSAPTTQSEKEYQNVSQTSNKNPNNHTVHIPRSSSVKNTTKKKSFNIKDFLTFTSNTNQTVKYHVSGKSDTFPPDKHSDPQLPNYQPINLNNSKHRLYNPVELPPEFQYCNDQTIIDSAKRVVEWQKKNEDVISKENKLKDNKIYQPINSQVSGDFRITKRSKSKIFNLSLFACCSASGKTKPDMNLRNHSTNKITIPYPYETDQYETIDATLSSPTGQPKIKIIRNQSRSANNTIYGITGVSSTTKNGAAPRSNSIIPYQTNNNNNNNNNNNKKTAPIGNDIYATVNKSSKKEASNKNISQLHKNKYKF